MDKNRIARPTRRGELALHSEAHRFSRAGKCGGRAGKQRVLTWGDPAGATGRGVSRGHSTEQRAGGWKTPVTGKPEDSMLGKGRTEQEPSDPVEDIATDDAGRPGSDEHRRGGKHGRVQEQFRIALHYGPQGPSLT